MKCPGQDSRYWQPGAIFESRCPQCGTLIEFFKDDTTRKCTHCGHRLANPKMDFGCASYCKFAEQCIGALPEEILAKRDDLLKDRIAIEMKKHYGRNFKRISSAMRIARHAEKIGKAEGGNLAVVLGAAYLHDIDASNAAASQTPATARSILSGLGASDALINEICELISRLHGQNNDGSKNYKILHDAVHITEWEENQKDQDCPEALRNQMISHTLMTSTGREIAAQMFQNKEMLK